MSKLGTILIMIFFCGAANASDLVVLADKSKWACISSKFEYEGDITYHECIDVKSGEMYISWAPLTMTSLIEERDQNDRNSREAACACSREIHGGSIQPGSIVCTGAYDPYVLRKRKVDPCSGDWEKHK